MNVALTPELENLIKERIHSGVYESATEVVETALRLLQERDEFLAARRNEIHLKIEAGLRSLDEGKGIDGEEAFRQLDERHAGYRGKRG